MRKFKALDKTASFDSSYCKVFLKRKYLNFQSDDTANPPERPYDLVAVVIHCGSGPNRGHYISIVKSHRFWLLFDDDMVDVSISIIFLTNFSNYDKYNLFMSLKVLEFHIRLKLGLNVTENWCIHHRRLLRSNFRHSKVIRDWLHPFLPVKGVLFIVYKPCVLNSSQLWLCFGNSLKNCFVFINNDNYS